MQTSLTFGDDDFVQTVLELANVSLSSIPLQANQNHGVCLDGSEEGG